jgi:hypothetical protein
MTSKGISDIPKPVIRRMLGKLRLEVGLEPNGLDNGPGITPKPCR